MSATKSAKKARVRYTPQQREEILTFISQQGRGGQAKAIKKYGVTAATLTTWRKQEGLIAPSQVNKTSAKTKNKAKVKTKAKTKDAVSAPAKSTAGISTQLQAIQDLGRIAGEIAELEAQLASLRKEFETAKSRL